MQEFWKLILSETWSSAGDLSPRGFTAAAGFVNPDLLLQGNRRPGVLPLSSPEVEQTIGGNTVHEIACHYGFQSRNHFARDFRNQFGESPSATLQRVSAPGMSVQSVSVAQSPQMAMALR